jgi:hypothetical protein
MSEPPSSEPEWWISNRQNGLGIVCLPEGALPRMNDIIGMFKILDPEVYSIVVLSGPWLVGGYYLSPMGWVSLDPPRYTMGH